jgi:hypothetical protein
MFEYLQYDTQCTKFIPKILFQYRSFPNSYRSSCKILSFLCHKQQKCDRTDICYHIPTAADRKSIRHLWITYTKTFQKLLATLLIFSIGKIR